MTYAIARACANGTLRNCPCDKELHGRALPDFPKWKWGGCSADLRQPMRLNRKLMDAGNSRRATESLRTRDHIDRHNHMAGRLVRSTDLPPSDPCCHSFDLNPLAVLVETHFFQSIFEDFGIALFC